MLDLHVIRNSGNTVRHNYNVIVLREGNVTEGAMYVILKGRVGVYKFHGTPSEREFPELTEGGFFGESIAFLNEPSEYTYVTLEETYLLPINRYNLPGFVMSEPELACEFLREFCLRACVNAAEGPADSPGRRGACMARSGHGDRAHPGPAMPAHAADGASGQPDGASDAAPPRGAGPDGPAAAGPDSAGPDGPAGPGIYVVPPGPTPPRDAASAVAAIQASAAAATAAAGAGAAAAMDPARADAARPGGRSLLFPEGHTHHEFPMDNTMFEYLVEIKYTCPICKTLFKSMKVKVSKLIRLTTDPDLRIRYKGIEPLHYEVVSCPNCLYSAFENLFETGRKINAQFLADLKAIKREVSISDGQRRDPFTVFAGYYLALLCAPKCFLHYRLIVARLSQKLWRLYGDCGDAAMEEAFSRKALESYLFVYENINIVDSKQMQQVSVMIAELYLKAGDAKKAREFFFRVKMDKSATHSLRGHCELRLDDIKLMPVDE
ncbi:MAG: DUF2225 domain-containing protein [Oscillospiraceae bacterium]|nr:DUF2225 domain-containing protein [Oscillospiraceae bacterium]